MAPFALWITGLPGSGKSSIAEEIRKRYPDFILLRMDDIRKVVTPEPTYSANERDIVYRCLVFTARMLVDHGHSVIIDATGNLTKWRDLARQLIRKYAEVYLKCPVELCMLREKERSETRGAPKEIYKKAGAGWPVPGITAPYEEPLTPELIIDTDRLTVQEAAQKIEDVIRTLQEHS